MVYPPCNCVSPIAVMSNRTANTETIVGADEWDGYYIIHLDVPARYHYADGRTELLQDIREAGDNLTVLPPSVA